MYHSFIIMCVVVSTMYLYFIVITDIKKNKSRIELKNEISRRSKKECKDTSTMNL